MESLRLEVDKKRRLVEKSPQVLKVFCDSNLKVERLEQ
jgi:hypothetical protein